MNITMTSYFRRLYHLVYDEYDPRTKDWLLVSGPEPLMIILSTYLYFCVLAGPQYMKNKSPYSLKKCMIIHNFSQVLFSIYMVYEALMSGWLYDYSYTCQPVDYSDSPLALRMARAVHLYYICKIIELLDTVFFVLRKKQRQISLLHLYHHVSMPIVAWIGVRYFPGGHPTFLGTLNSFVHIFMYAYYMLTAYDPGMQKNLWIKKFITILQITQFVCIGFHSGQMLFTNCNFPKFWSTAIVIDSLVFCYMFTSFYINNYTRSKDNCRENGVALSNGYATSKID